MILRVSSAGSSAPRSAPERAMPVAPASRSGATSAAVIPPMATTGSVIPAVRHRSDKPPLSWDGDRIGQRFGRDALCDAPGREVEIGRNAVGRIVESEIFEEAPCIEGVLMMEQTSKDGKECEGRTDRETVDREFAQ